MTRQPLCAFFDDDPQDPHLPSERATHVFRVLRRAMGDLAEWRLWLREADKPGDSDETDGETALTPRYRKAVITIRRGLDTRREREVIAHELCHVLLGTIDQNIHRIVDLVPEDQREHALDLYTDGLEPVCERLAFAVLNLLPDSVWKESDDD